jgi:probable F420-dependent oxidoreductase
MLAGVRIGALIFLTDKSIRPAQLAVELEQRGFESFWVVEHTHIPTSRKTPWPGGEPIPEEYTRTLDPYVALSAAAAVTERLVLATGITLVAQHHPITLAKTVASLDLISNGRVELGIGVGWNVDEMEHHGVDPTKRRAIVRESVLAMKALWTMDEASFDGAHIKFSPSWSWPKPVRKPHPPIVMGGAGGPLTFRDIVEYCDGWMPIHGRRGVFEKLPELHAAAEAAGRDPASIELGVFGCPPKPEVIASYGDAGFTRCVLGLPPAPADVVLKVLDGYAPLLASAS